jgi:hypothetical protein
MPALCVHFNFSTQFQMHDEIYSLLLLLFFAYLPSLFSSSSSLPLSCRCYNKRQERESGLKVRSCVSAGAGAAIEYYYGDIGHNLYALVSEMKILDKRGINTYTHCSLSRSRERKSEFSFEARSEKIVMLVMRA